MPRDFQLEVIGCGNAYDGEHTNASVLVTEGGYQLLIDCGPTVPAALFAQGRDPHGIDAVYLTHAHPDHCLGLTALLNWMAANGRRRPLALIAQHAQWRVIAPLIDYAFWPQATGGFPLVQQDSETVASLGPWALQTSLTRHAVPNRSLHVTTAGGHQLFYSGDGLLSPAGEWLAAQSDWVFLECEVLDHHPSHGSWQAIAPVARKPGSQWRLYHISPHCRPELRARTAGIAGLALAQEGETLAVASIGVRSARA